MTEVAAHPEAVGRWYRRCCGVRRESPPSESIVGEVEREEGLWGTRRELPPAELIVGEVEFGLGHPCCSGHLGNPPAELIVGEVEYRSSGACALRELGNRSGQHVVGEVELLPNGPGDVKPADESKSSGIDPVRHVVGEVERCARWWRWPTSSGIDPVRLVVGEVEHVSGCARVPGPRESLRSGPVVGEVERPQGVQVFDLLGNRSGQVVAGEIEFPDRPFRSFSVTP